MLIAELKFKKLNCSHTTSNLTKKSTAYIKKQPRPFGTRLRVFSNELLRRQTVRSAIEVSDLPDIPSVEENHEKPCEPDPEPSVRRTAVTEKVEIVLKWREGQPLFARLPFKDLDAMLALSARRHLKPLPKKVEALGQARVFNVPHVIERTLLWQ